MAKSKYEGSKADIKEDKKGAKKMGVTLKAYEQTNKDKQQDKRGQKRMARRSG